MINVDLLYPVGSIYLSIKSKNPSEIFGGVWEEIAKGRTLVGVDENDTDFSSAEKLGGEKKHTLTINEMPSHQHELSLANYGSENVSSVVWSNQNSQKFAYAYDMIKPKGGDQPHNNLQPYFTCYIFVRTA